MKKTEGLVKQSVEGMNVSSIKFRDEYLIPSSEIAQLHGVEVRVINQAFKRHQHEFVRGVDYHVFTREELSRYFPDAQKLIQDLFTNNKQKVVYFFSLSGYFNFVKSINSEHAWKMFHRMKEIVFRVVEVDRDDYIRSVTKELRKELTAVVNDSGEQERMHGHGYSNYTLMVYHICGLKKDYMNYHKENPDGNFRDTLSSEDLLRVKACEGMTKEMLEIGIQYEDIKKQLGSVFGLLPSN